MKFYPRSTKLLLCSTLLATAATAVECGGSDNMASESTTLKGRMSDSNGSQPQSLKILSGMFGGSGSVAAATKVRVSRLKADGSLDLIVESAVKADGRYEVAVPPHEKRLICQGFDASGNVLMSAIVEGSGEIGETVTVTPMDTETSVEAAVLAKMAAIGVSLQECNAIDLRERISLDVAQAVKAATDAEVKIKALAEAIAAAQSAKVKAYAAAGVNTSQSALFEAQLAAVKKLDLALDAASSAAATTQAYVDFHGALDAGLLTLDASMKKHARVESVSSVAFRATLKARLSATADAMVDASLRTAASAEARLSAAAVNALLLAGQASAQATTAASMAATTLRTQTSAAATAAASATAFGAWNASITGGPAVTGSVLGIYLDVTAQNAAMAQGAVNATTTATMTLETTLKSAAAAISATAAIDYNVLAQSIVSAYAAYQTALDSQVTGLSTFGAKAQSAIDVMATVSGSFRLQ